MNKSLETRDSVCPRDEGDGVCLVRKSLGRVTHSASGEIKPTLGMSNSKAMSHDFAPAAARMGLT